MCGDAGPRRAGVQANKAHSAAQFSLAIMRRGGHLAEIERLRKDGLGGTAIARNLGIGRAGVYRVLQS